MATLYDFVGTKKNLKYLKGNLIYLKNLAHGAENIGKKKKEYIN